MVRYENEKVKSRIFFFLCMVLAGSIIANILLRCDRELQSFVIPYVESGSLSQTSQRQVFLYILMQRLKQVIVIYLLYKVFPPQSVFAGVLSILLFLLGFSISCQLYYLGLNGVFYLLLCLLPHYLFYLFLIYYLSVHINKPGDAENGKIMILGIAGLIFLTAVLSESLLSKIFLKNFLQYMGM